jgi:putative hydrolase of the HAD superfamily
MSVVPTSKVQAVVFDYGAVLCELPTTEQLDEFSAAARLPREQFWKLYLSTRAPFDRGSLNAPGYWRYFGERAERQYSTEEIQRLSELDVSVWRRMNPSMLALVGEVRDAGLKTALLSNMPADLMMVIRREERWLDLFDQQFFSCEIGAVKPEREIYEHVVKSLGVEPQASLLIDDNPDNISAARAFGMRALHYQSFSALIPQLAAELDGAGPVISKLLQHKAQ